MGSRFPSNQLSYGMYVLDRYEQLKERRVTMSSAVLAYSLVTLFGFVAGGFILGAMHNPVLLIVVAGVFGGFATVFVWNSCLGRSAITGFIARVLECRAQDC